VSERDKLISAGVVLNTWGHVPATSGNFSCLLSPGKVLITASGCHKGQLEHKNFIEINPQDGSVINSKEKARPSAETDLHLNIYKHCSSARAVLHSHSPMASLASMPQDRSKISLQSWELLKAFDGIDSHEQKIDIPIFDNSQNMNDIIFEFEQYLQSHQLKIPVYLIRGHGAYCWSSSVERCLHQLEALEYLLNLEKLACRI
jgi:methylthioribulose-1-phosphate dehydratase